ncbi:MAG: hypothetical protein JWQ86_1816 [Mycobacterium sp.]|jgi:hypothetical protein|nr:hypothetical protein [Mycobacterium sp.]MDT5213311.1 hypothetical protein [Mycobacterium sp.]
MAMNKAFGPVLTLVAVATLGGGIWLMNVSQESAPAASTTSGDLDGNAITGTLGSRRRTSRW